MRKITRLNILLALVVMLTFNVNPTVAHAQGNTRPRVVVSGYSIENDGLVPGQATKVSLTLKNMSEQYPVYSVLLTTVSQDNNYTVQYGSSNQAYINQINPNEEASVEIYLTANADLNVEDILCDINIVYIDDINGSSELASEIVIPIKKEYLQIQRLYIPENVLKNEKSRISITCENDTKQELYNAVMTIRGESIEETSIELGTISNGSKRSQEVYLNFNTIGTQEITVEVTCKDAKGNSYTTLSDPYKVIVSENEKVDSDIRIQKNNLNNSDFVQKMGYLAAIFICGIVAVAALIRNKKN